MLFTGAQSASADDLSTGPFTSGGLIDVYSAHDFNDPPTLVRPYTTQVVHEDQIDINLGMVEAKLATADLRGRLAFQHGTSVTSNYAAEEYLFWRYIQEATAGVKFSDKLWFDGGIYLAHMGFESFNSRDNWNYTRSLVADYSPYYEAGAKLSYQINDALTTQFHVVHGWQNISSGAEPMYGLQLSYALNPRTQFTYNNCVGHQFGGLRNFHDFIVKRDFNEKLSVAAQFDFGTQGRQEDDRAFWHGWALMSRYKFTPAVALGSRVERFFDPHHVVIQTLNGPSFDAVGLSANLDVELYPKLVWRNEYRTFLGENVVFPKDEEGHFSKNDSFVVTALVYSF